MYKEQQFLNFKIKNIFHKNLINDNIINLFLFLYSYFSYLCIFLFKLHEVFERTLASKQYITESSLWRRISQEAPPVLSTKDPDFFSWVSWCISFIRRKPRLIQMDEHSTDGRFSLSVCSSLAVVGFLSRNKCDDCGFWAKWKFYIMHIKGGICCLWMLSSGRWFISW